MTSTSSQIKSFFSNIRQNNRFQAIANVVSGLKQWAHPQLTHNISDIQLDTFNRSLNAFRRRSSHVNAERKEEEKLPFYKRIIDPTQKHYYYWISICFSVYLYNLVFIITRTAFTQLQQLDSWFIWCIFDYAFSDIIYILDIIFNFQTGFMQNGELCKDRKQIKRLYIKSLKFKIDILSIIPLDLFYFAISNSYKQFYPALRLNKLIKFHRYTELIALSETKTAFPNIFRMTHLVLNILLLIHWNACIYFLISYIIGFGADDWVYPAFIDERNYTSHELNNMLNTNELTTQYIYSLWWSTLTLTTIAEINPPTIWYEELYTIVLLLIGVVVIAIIIGSTSSMFKNANLQRKLLQDKCDRVKLFLRQYKIDKQFEKRINAYLDYLRNNPNLDQQDSILDCLPDELNRAIAMNIHMDTLKRVVIFQDCEPGVLRDLVTKLKVKLFSPGDYVCRKGDIGREMYFIKTGRLEVVSEDGKKVFAILNAGAYFGEISILEIPGNKNGNKRTASIRSVGFADLFQLTKDDLWSVLSEYPLARSTLLEKGKALLRKDNLLDEELAEKYERKQKDAYAQLDNLEICFVRVQKRFDENFSKYAQFLQGTRQKLTFLENKIQSLAAES